MSRTPQEQAAIRTAKRVFIAISTAMFVTVQVAMLFIIPDQPALIRCAIGLGMVASFWCMIGLCAAVVVGPLW